MRLGEEVADVSIVGSRDGVGAACVDGTRGVLADIPMADVCDKDCVGLELDTDGGATAAAAAAAYLIGVDDGGFCDKLAFSMLAIGCWAKLMFGGGLATKGYVQEVNTTVYKR